MIKKRSLFFVSAQLLRFTSIVCLVSLAGCLVGPDYSRPEMPLPDKFDAASDGGVGQAEAASTDLTKWWESFGDEKLCSLIGQAVVSNLDLRQAESRIRQARGNLAIAVSSLFPTIDSFGSYKRSRSSGSVERTTGNDSSSTNTITTPTSKTTNLFQAGFDSSWELDLFSSGRAIESASDTVEAQEAARRNTLVTLLAEVAQNYITLRGLQAELRIAQKNIADQNETLSLQRERQVAGIANELSVVQTEAQLKSFESQVPVLETEIQQAIHHIGVLLDKDPASLEAELSAPGDLPAGPPAIPAGLPSELLLRRPDIAVAERELAAATANVGYATADLYPKFLLTGTFGLESSALHNFADSASRIWSFGPTITLPIFNAGLIRANISIKEAQQEEAYLKYRQTVLQALEEVENALNGYNLEQVRRNTLRESVDANRRALNLARQLNDAGLIDFLNVLTAHQAVSQSEDNLQQSETAVSTKLVVLYKALGGGWESIEAEGNSPPETTEVTD